MKTCKSTLYNFILLCIMTIFVRLPHVKIRFEISDIVSTISCEDAALKSDGLQFAYKPGMSTISMCFYCY